MRIVAALLLGLVSGSVAFALTRWHPSQISTRMERFDTLLSTSGVEPGERVRDILEVQAVRRHVLGAFGGGVGYAVTFTASLLLGGAVVDGASGILAMIGYWFGAAIGQSLSALFPVESPHGRVLMTAMHPHGMTQYLRRREIGVESAIAALGWGSAIVGAVVLTDVVRIPIVGGGARPLVVIGVLWATVATTTLLVQRRLVAAPLRAADADGLAAAEIVLMLGLQDLLHATVMTTVMAAWMTAWLPGRTWWLVAFFAVVPIGVGLAVRAIPRRPDVHPLAQRTAVRSRVA
jgi:hypothetical protein